MKLVTSRPHLVAGSRLFYSISLNAIQKRIKLKNFEPIIYSGLTFLDIYNTKKGKKNIKYGNQTEERNKNH